MHLDSLQTLVSQLLVLISVKCKSKKKTLTYHIPFSHVTSVVGPHLRCKNMLHRGCRMYVRPSVDESFFYSLTFIHFWYSRGTKVEKMLTLAPKRYTAEFCMVAKVTLWCIWNHCIADSIDLHNARAVNFLRKPSKNMSKYYFSKCYIFLSKKFKIGKYWVYIIIQHRRRPQKQWWSSKNTAYWFLKHVD